MTAGERWAADALTALRDQRFTPEAIATFVNASLHRATDMRAAQPVLARQAHRWIATGVIGVLVLRETADRHGRPVPTRRVLSVWLALMSLMLDWHLGMVEGLAGEPREQLTAADALTLARAGVVPLIASAPPDGVWFTLLLAGAGFTDLLDGALARAAGPTRFGRDFDSLADTAFRLSALRGAGRANWITAGARRALVARQALLATRATWHWFAHSTRPPTDQPPLTRWHVPLMLIGLAAGSLGHKRAASRLLYTSALLGSIK